MNITQILLIYMIASATAEESGSQLKKVIVVIRHGLRAPLRRFKIIPYCTEEYFPAGMGQLTNKGKRESFKLGKKLLKRYKTFIEPHNIIAWKDIKAVSTHEKRCLETAQAVLAGFYPLDRNQTWSSVLKWQPIPILSNSPDNTAVIATPQQCPYIQRLQNEILLSNISHLEEFQRIKNEAAKHDKYQEINQTIDVINLVNAVSSVVAEGYNLPKWMADFYPEVIQTLEIKEYEILISSSKKLLRFVGGTLLNDLIKRIDEVSENNEFSKFYFYAGHDTTIFTLLTVLGIPQKRNSDFAASLIFEIYSTLTDNFAIKVIYSQDDSFAQKEVKVQNCDILCPVEKFKELFSDLRLTSKQYENECNDL